MSAYTDRTHTGISMVSSSKPPSTVGGRKAQRSEKKKKRSTKIRQGSANEEAALAAHLATLAPQPSVLQVRN